MRILTNHILKETIREHVPHHISLLFIHIHIKNPLFHFGLVYITEKIFVVIKKNIFHPLLYLRNFPKIESSLK